MPDNFRALSCSLDGSRWIEDISIRGETARGKVIGPKMKKRKLGRALESVREDFRVGKHTGLSVLRVRISPRSFSSSCRHSVGLLSSSYRTNSLFARAFFAWQPSGHVHARTCAICLRAQYPLISARYTLAGDGFRKVSRLALLENRWNCDCFQIGSKTIVNTCILFIYFQFLFRIRDSVILQIVGLKKILCNLSKVFYYFKYLISCLHYIFYK